MGQRNLTEIGLIRKRYHELMADFDFRQLSITKQLAHLKEEGMVVCYPTIQKWSAELKTIHAEEWLEAARKNVAPKSLKVDDALYEKCLKGDVEAIRTWYAKNEGWSAKQVSEITTIPQEVRGTTDEELKLESARGLQREQLEKIIKEKGLTIIEPVAQREVVGQ